MWIMAYSSMRTKSPRQISIININIWKMNCIITGSETFTKLLLFYCIHNL
jgi:hypothetical protein